MANNSNELANKLANAQNKTAAGRNAGQALPGKKNPYATLLGEDNLNRAKNENNSYAAQNEAFSKLISKKIKNNEIKGTQVHELHSILLELADQNKSVMVALTSAKLKTKLNDYNAEQEDKIVRLFLKAVNDQKIRKILISNIQKTLLDKNGQLKPGYERSAIDNLMNQTTALTDEVHTSKRMHAAYSDKWIGTLIGEAFITILLSNRPNSQTLLESVKHNNESGGRPIPVKM